MSRLCELKEGDDIREISIQLTSDPVPSTALLIISGNGLRIEKELNLEEGATDADDRWKYRFTDADFTEFGAAQNLTFKLEVYATFGDGTNGTYPTRGTLTLKVYKKL